ncbi:methyl-accepting chemotaxis protein [Eubacteriaceae bacterium ES2]|nr:methyl-accepting chemotaxis protein [Eubacteriaceae bacterium ES2]
MNLMTTRMLQKPLAGIRQRSQSIANGHFEVTADVSVNDELGEATKALSETAQVLQSLTCEVEKIVVATMNGDLSQRGNESRYEGSYQSLLSQINGLAQVFSSLLEALPFPAVLMDNNQEIKFANGRAADVFGLLSDDLCGRKCAEVLGADVCGSENCPGKIVNDTNNIASALTMIGDVHYELINTPFIDSEGQLIGQMEILVDQTKIRKAQFDAEAAYQRAEEEAAKVEKHLIEAEKQAQCQKEIATQADEQAKAVQRQVALAEKVSQYQEREVEKLVASLSRLAVGDLSIEIDEPEYDEDTESIAMMYQMINMSLSNSVRAINSYIEEITRTLSEMAEKDFTGEVEGLFMGDFVSLKDSINHILEQMNRVLSEIQSASAQVESGTEQIADASSSLAQGSSEQASSIQEISATITEVAAQTKQNAINANKANELSEKARQEAQNGNQQMHEMLAAMDQISESSQGIARIIKVIDDIAFQTNILSLNAAVEAARAGEHGKGFAVVAEEVRSLAARSAQAARETTELIESSVRTVEEGNKMAKIAAESLESIVSGVANAVDIVGLIAQASNEQATAINEINIGVDQIAEVTQKNTATAEESASASQQIASQAQLLEGMISDFRLKN